MMVQLKKQSLASFFTLSFVLGLAACGNKIITTTDGVAPRPPTNPGGEVTDTIVRFEWDPNPETDLAGYRFYTTPVSGTYSSFVDVGLVTTTSTPVPPPGVTHYYMVTAYNTAGLESLPSNEVYYPDSVAPAALPTPPVVRAYP